MSARHSGHPMRTPPRSVHSQSSHSPGPGPLPDSPPMPVSPSTYRGPQSFTVKTGDGPPPPSSSWSRDRDPRALAHKVSGFSDRSDPEYALSRVNSASRNETHRGLRAALGLRHEAPIAEEHDTHPHQENLWPRIRTVLREPFAEFWGVFVLVLFGNGSVAQVLLSEGLRTAPGGNGYGNYQSISWGWGLGTMLGIYVAGDSGAYLNPAITLAFCIFRGLPFRRWPVYLLAQFLGGFCAAGVVYANYIPAVNNYAGVGVRTVPPDTKATAQIFCTFPADFLDNGTQFVSEFIASSVLMFVIFALKDETNIGAALGSKNWFPLALFFLIFGIGACFGWETGYAINLARDFAPRCMAYAVGYTDVFAAGDYFFWVPIVASFVGCFFGALMYDLFIYTGPESPVNSPYMGLPHLLNPVQAMRKRQLWRRESEEERPYRGPGDAKEPRV